MSKQTSWDESNFESMSWHDNRVHAVTFSPDNFEFGLDLDYIVEWYDPAKDENNFSFSLAPATLLFQNASNIIIDVIIDNIYELFVKEITQSFIKKSPNQKFNIFKYAILFHHNGKIELEATGFKQNLRKEPVKTNAQSFTVNERGGISINNKKTAT